MSAYISVSDMRKLMRDTEVFFEYKDEIFRGEEQISAQSAKERLCSLFSSKDDPHIACALGCLHCSSEYNDGKPDCDSAFPLLVNAASNGVIYAKLMLAEIYADANGGRFSPMTAKNLIQSAYDDALDSFSFEGEADDFAECAMRMGRIKAEGIGYAQNLREAYGHFLEARMAAESMEYGEELHACAEDSLADLKNRLPEGFFRGYITSGFPWFIRYMVDDGSSILVSASEEEDGDLELTVRRIGRKTEQPGPMLMTFPEISCSILSNTLKVRAVGPEASFSDGDEIRADEIVWRYPEKRLVFFRSEKVTGHISCREFRVYPQDSADRPEVSAVFD